MNKSRIPSYRIHKTTGQAVVVHKNRSYYLGNFGTPESRVAYDRVLADILARRSSATPPAPPHPRPRRRNRPRSRRFCSPTGGSWLSLWTVANLVR